MPTPAPNSGKRTILPIQYLRGIAALMVVWFHARGQIPGVEELVGGTFGASGVDLFFAISGFIMVVTTSGTTLSPWEFLKRRFMRVAPPYWILTLLMVAVASAIPSLFRTLIVTPTTLVQSLLFIPHFSASFPNKVYPLLVPGWTLDMEMFFYSMFAISLFLQERQRLATLAVTVVALAATGLFFGPFGSAVAKTYTSPLLLEFAAGAIIGRWWIGGKMRLPVAASLLLMIGGAVLMVVREGDPPYRFTQVIAASFIVVGALNSRFHNWDNRVLRELGDSSYSLYLSHVFTLGVLRVGWTKILPVTSTLSGAVAFMIISLVVCAIVGVLMYHWLEVPLSRVLKRRASVSPA